MAKLQDRVAAIIFCKKQNNIFLPLVKYTFKHVYDIPRGGVDPTDKNFIHALKREIYEELSLDLSNNKFFKVGTYEEWHRNKRSGVMLHYNIHSFVTSIQKLLPIKPIDTKEIESCDWYLFTQGIKLLYQTKNMEPIKQIYKAYLIALRYNLV